MQHQLKKTIISTPTFNKHNAILVEDQKDKDLKPVQFLPRLILILLLSL